MKPGKELDALIAVKVMGWECIMKHTSTNGVCNCTHDHYSTDIAAACEVVERLIRIGDGLAVEYHGGGWTAGWHRPVSATVFERGETPPHAICLVALEAAANE